MRVYRLLLGVALDAGRLGATTAGDPGSPYAGHEGRPIASLSAAEMKGSLADRLHLTAGQRR